MDVHRPAQETCRVSRFDGQSIWSADDELLYELGNYLGGGISGVVYEATDQLQKASNHYALKILNPVGYKLERKAALKQCTVAIKGEPLRKLEDEKYEQMGGRHVWWLVHTRTSQVVAAYHDVERGDVLREMTLPKCMQVWGLPAVDSKDDRSNLAPEREVTFQGRSVLIPGLPPKYLEFLRARERIYREISHMYKLSEHKNVLRLHNVLEMTHDSKTTIFLVLELAKGGELFDRIAVDEGADEATTRRFFTQLLDGVRHCHDQGVCHRDLKPENLLLADDDGTNLKIADFGLSAVFQPSGSQHTPEGSSLSVATPNTGSGPGTGVTPPAEGLGGLDGAVPLPISPSATSEVAMRKLRSVVGSPFYVAPEILTDSAQGYDGTKADMWSIGVILYAMLAGNLPFGKDLHNCLRFRKFSQWVDIQRQQSGQKRQQQRRQLGRRMRPRRLDEEVEAEEEKGDDDMADDDVGGFFVGEDEEVGEDGAGQGEGTPSVDFDVSSAPHWLFPPKFSSNAKSLLCSLLNPEPRERLSVHQAQTHAWVAGDAPVAAATAAEVEEVAASVATTAATSEPAVSAAAAKTPSTTTAANDAADFLGMDAKPAPKPKLVPTKFPGGGDEAARKETAERIAKAQKDSEEEDSREKERELEREKAKAKKELDALPVSSSANATSATQGTPVSEDVVAAKPQAQPQTLPKAKAQPQPQPPAPAPSAPPVQRSVSDSDRCSAEVEESPSPLDSHSHSHGQSNEHHEHEVRKDEDEAMPPAQPPATTPTPATATAQAPAPAPPALPTEGGSATLSETTPDSPPAVPEVLSPAPVAAPTSTPNDDEVRSSSDLISIGSEAPAALASPQLAGESSEEVFDGYAPQTTARGGSAAPAAQTSAATASGSGLARNLSADRLSPVGPPTLRERRESEQGQGQALLQDVDHTAAASEPGSRPSATTSPPRRLLDHSINPSYMSHSPPLLSSGARHVPGQQPMPALIRTSPSPTFSVVSGTSSTNASPITPNWNQTDDGDSGSSPRDIPGSPRRRGSPCFTSPPIASPFACSPLANPLASPFVFQYGLGHSPPLASPSASPHHSPTMLTGLPPMPPFSLDGSATSLATPTPTPANQQRSTSERSTSERGSVSPSRSPSQSMLLAHLQHGSPPRRTMPQDDHSFAGSLSAGGGIVEGFSTRAEGTEALGSGGSLLSAALGVAPASSASPTPSGLHSALRGTDGSGGGRSRSSDALFNSGDELVSVQGLGNSAAGPHADVTPREFQDLVKRSTRFMTSVPAVEVLIGVQEIIAADQSPLPYPYRNIKQRTVMHWDDYRLDVKWGGILVYSVQVFLVRSNQGHSQYMVEFRRCQMDIFQFKRSYENLRQQLTRYMSSHHALLEDPTFLVPHESEMDGTRSARSAYGL